MFIVFTGCVRPAGGIELLYQTETVQIRGTFTQSNKGDRSLSLGVTIYKLMLYCSHLL